MGQPISEERGIISMENFISTIKDTFVSWYDFVISQVKTIGVADIIDILLVSVILFYAFKFLRERRAGRLAVGVGVLILISLVASYFELSTISYVLQNIFQVGLLALIIIFQPELRSALEKVAAEPIKGIKAITEQKDDETMQKAIEGICDAVCDMSKDKTGAIIVMERDTKLGEYVKSGVIVDAAATSFLIKNIFFKNAPLHDGAVIIRDARVYAAGCFLPLSTSESIIKDLGTRHRAAIGMSEVSDAIVIVVSEENGTISVAFDGNLRRNYDYSRLEKVLTEIFVTSKGKSVRRRRTKARKSVAALSGADKESKTKESASEEDGGKETE